MPKTTLNQLKKEIAARGIEQLSGQLDSESQAWLRSLGAPEANPKNITEGYSEADDLFGENEIPVGPSGFKGLMDFCRTVAHNKSDSRLVKDTAERGLESGDPESAGVLVPVEYSTQIIKLAIEKGKIFPLCTMVKMKTAEEKIPVAASLDESAGKLYGGIEFLWVDETKDKTEKIFKMQRVNLRANTAAALCKASNSLLEDSSPKADRVIRDLFSDAFKNFMDNEIVNGTGAGRGLGILRAPCLYTVAKETGQAATTINFRNVTKMMMRMYPDGKDHCVWLINDECLDQVWNMSQVVGTGGSNVMIANGTAENIRPKPVTLLSRPIIWNSHGTTLGQAGDIILADLRQMLIGMRKQLTIDVSIHVHFISNQTLYRIEARLDYQPILPSTMRTRTNFEVAPFVTLAKRE